LDSNLLGSRIVKGFDFIWYDNFGGTVFVLF
jgi:hypothetical protein